MIFAQILQSTYRLHHISKDTIGDAVVTYARRNKRNEVQDWLKALKWDGKPRLETWLSRCLNVDDTVYHKQVGENVLRAMAARILKPGCKADEMMVLVGGQGTRKSAIAEILGGAWYAVTYDKVDSLNFMLSLRGRLVVEMAELETMKKSEVEAVKRMLSSSFDRFAEKYSNQASDTPRTCVFIGTSNPSEFLGDPTGARRFWPVTVGVIDTDILLAERSQLFAEARVQVEAGEKWHIVDDAKRHQARHRQTDPWDEDVEEFIAVREEVIISEILIDCLGVPKARTDRLMARRVGAILRAMDWEPHITTRNKVSFQLWKPSLSVIKEREAAKRVPF